MELSINDFNYELPDDRIALFPTPKREQSKLLVFDGKNIQHKQFKDIVDIIPADSLLIFNNSKVVPARMHFKKESGASIEIFLLGPENSQHDYQAFFNSKSTVRCSCTIGNKTRWKKDLTLQQTKSDTTLKAVLVDSLNSIVEFQWSGDKTWSEIVDLFGSTPLPPYINREVDEMDKIRYQTVYSTEPGAVAAPTAGLHFTPEILALINQKGIKTDFLTLHVGAGTFLPVRAEKVSSHIMHQENIVFSRQNIETLLNHTGKVIPVGTTSCRSLESLYWFGYKLVKKIETRFFIDQELPYISHDHVTKSEALAAILRWMNEQSLNAIQGSTSIFIYPPYQFRICDALITNFHQPGSTLILLIAAFIGHDWRRVYNEALMNNYRFLSYGDSSILFKQRI